MHSSRRPCRRFASSRPRLSLGVSPVGRVIRCPRGYNSLMSHYRRASTVGGTYFFTVVTYRRQTFLCDEDVRVAMRTAIHRVRKAHPFHIDAWVLLPDHLHCVWTLPPGDADFSQRWNLIKRWVTRACGERLSRTEWITDSKRSHRESTLETIGDRPRLSAIIQE